MNKVILSIALFSFAAAGFSTTWTISNSGSAFTPSAITINLGDIVDFSLGSTHNAVEVSLDTWNANGVSPLSGGFSTLFGGGLVQADKLTLGTHYYVCANHGPFGMKGTITVIDATGVAENSVKENISIFPNPSKGNFKIELNYSQSGGKYDLGIYNVRGAKVYSKTDLQQQNLTNIEIADLPKGIYILKLNGGKDTYSKKIVVQ
jgi:plastocyanin